MMGKVKTIQDYESRIRELYAEIKKQETKIKRCTSVKAPKKDIALVKKKLEADLETLKSQLYNQLKVWADLVDITIFQSPEEHYPWEEKDLGHPVRKMLTKAEISIEQTADYQAYYQGVGYAGWVPFIVERKGGKEAKKGQGIPNDVYATLSSAHSRETFYKEIKRFKADTRFTQMYLIAECSYEDYIKYIPAYNGVDKNGHAKRNTNHIGVSVATREATIAGLEMRGCHVIFAGSRGRAIKMYKDLLRQWVIKNYTTVLGLGAEPYNDAKALSDKIAYHEAELLALRASLAGIKKQQGEVEA